MFITILYIYKISVLKATTEMKRLKNQHAEGWYVTVMKTFGGHEILQYEHMCFEVPV